MDGTMVFRFACCVGPLVILGLAVMAFSTFTLITGKGGSWRDSMGNKRAQGSPTTTRILSIIGLIVGFMIACIGGAAGFALVFYTMSGVQ